MHPSSNWTRTLPSQGGDTDSSSVGCTKIKVKEMKRFPDDYTHEELTKLVLYHRDKHVEISTKYHDTLDKLKEARIELSKLKRNK